MSIWNAALVVLVFIIIVAPLPGAGRILAIFLAAVAGLLVMHAYQTAHPNG